MKKEFKDVITDQLGVHPIELNSALDSAQNRKRLYWASWGIMPQIDKGIMLGDILLTRKEIEETHYYGQKSIEYMDRGNEKYGINKRSDRYTQTTDTDKSFTVTANFHKGIPYNYFKEDRPQADLVGKQGKGFGNQGQTGVRCIEVGHAEEIKGHDTIRRVYSPNGKAPTLTTMQGGNREPKVSIGAFRGRYLVDGKRQDHKMKTQGLTTQRLEVRGDSKSNTLTTVQKDNVVVEEQIRWRALTPIECERLMTMEDNSTLYGIDDKGNQKTISKTQRYKMLGNGWVIDTIAHCLKYLEGRI
jgi:site-specific DNA-cytosine methylase